MAYNNGFPVGYQPVYFQPQYQPQLIGTQMSSANQQPQIQTQPSIIWISSLNEALSYPVAPNNAVTLWSTAEPIVYLKSADATGKPTLKTYDLVERTQTASKGIETADGKTIEYAEKNDVVAIAGAVKGINELVASMQADIDAMKGDLYGVAGRKRTRKKEETEEE